MCIPFLFNFVQNYNLFQMSDLNKDLEALVGDMGMSVSDEAPTTEEQPVEQPQEVVQEAPETPVEVVEETTEPAQETTPVAEEPIQEVVEEQQQEEAVQEMPQSSLEETEEITEEELEATMLEYLSERLGRQVSSFDEINGTQDTSVEIDERVAAINEFVRETGRDPQDWFTYQAMNPSEMDDLTAVKTQLRTQYGDLSDSDLNLLLNNKYKLDAEMYEENEIRLSQIQLKMDADKARQEIEGLRSQYTAPVRQEQPVQQQEEPQGIVNEEWLGTMSAEVDALEGIEFSVSKDKSFTFGLEDNYKSQLKSKNENIEDFFSSYVSDGGQWDFEKWNMHQAVLDNIETIVKTAYQQGLGEGQRSLVDKAANVQYQQPNETANTSQGQGPSIEDQVRQALGLNDNGLTFKI
jgi:hypothetical protein